MKRWVIGMLVIPVLVITASLVFFIRTARADGPITVLPLGDSITVGIGDGKTGGQNSGYRCLLKSYLAAQGEQIDFVGSQVSGTCGDNEHEGHSGWTIDQMTQIAAARVDTYQPDVVLLMAGTNDLKPVNKKSAAGINERLATLIDVIKQAKPDVLVIVATIPSYPAADQAAWRAYRGDVPTIAMEHGAQTGYGNNVQPFELADGIHPSACGYVKLAFYLDAAFTASVPSPNGRTWAPIWPQGGCVK